ncbi:hypothetical protein NVP1244A_104 [Vibrio phage 1.244.A._10N.261.54.C3]|nr:hypothetical protein NVP1244A_104 [Vibrio phage 1.244.A._10N.261.54.C3]AUR98732.1 hypothetical protein NVP1255O_104 [Vibrio phage 1.255.O._10N.286.45.F1]
MTHVDVIDNGGLFRRPFTKVVGCKGYRADYYNGQPFKPDQCEPQSIDTYTQRDEQQRVLLLPCVGELGLQVHDIAPNSSAATTAPRTDIAPKAT